MQTRLEGSTFQQRLLRNLKKQKYRELLEVCDCISKELTDRNSEHGLHCLMCSDYPVNTKLCLHLLSMGSLVLIVFSCNKKTV